MREFCFKRDPQAQLEYWAIHNGQLAKRGAREVLKFADVQSVIWTDMTLRHVRVRQLDLFTETDQIKIACHDQGNSGDSQMFLKLSFEVAHAIDTEVPVKIETRPLARLFFWRRPRLVFATDFIALIRGMIPPMDRPEDDA